MTSWRRLKSDAVSRLLGIVAGLASVGNTGLATREFAGLVKMTEVAHVPRRRDAALVHIVNSGRYTPNAWVPPFIGPALIEAETRKHFGEIRTEILRRSERQAGSTSQ